jgi:predicted RNase H-like HicB family nuclease
MNYTAVIQQHGEWWIGWVEEVPGVNSQGKTRDELLDNLRDALAEALEMNRDDDLNPWVGMAMINEIMVEDDKNDPYLESYQRESL